MNTIRTTSKGHQRRVALASLIGGSIEYYEFFIYGLTASLVFGKLFFPSADPVAGTLLALSTFAVAFIARPIGGWLFGHFGDRLGRRTVLILTLVGMGAATTLVGLLPGYGTIGTASPVLLVVLRLVQGLSVAGETTGGFLLTYEHTERDGRSGLFTGVVSTGNLVGLVLANAAFFLANLLPDGQYLVWGWRLPFLFSAVLVGVGLYVRSRLAESPDFTEVKAAGKLSRNPAMEVVREHRARFVGLILVTVPQSICFYMASVFSITYATKIGVSAATVSLIIIAVCALMIVTMPLFGLLADRTGRPKVIFGLGLVLMSVDPFIWFPLFNTGKLVLIGVGFVLVLGGFSINYSTQGMFFPSLFPAHLRYTAIGISVALGGVLGGALAPEIALCLLDRFDSWVPVAWYMTGTTSISAITVVLLKPYRGPAAAHREAISELRTAS